MTNETVEQLAEALAAEQDLNASQENDLADLKRRVAILEAVLAMDAQGTGSERLAGLERRLEGWATIVSNHIELIHDIGGER